jgi:UDP-N-acetylglucosamine diphosphorylase / glucose-1-phosphate thymidylyltransferase / UDP-N-acetylgalactosamine diphosphorylase / glucosamine-1-phosphate N-acetyltransferase / galactosamine-1-phosphate N-acetyltransferase
VQGIILAAGQGSRLQPITLTRSKAMVPILGKPIVERVMEDLQASGVDDFVLVVSPDDRYISRYFRRESTIAADVRFVYQPQRLGMANALQCAAPLISDDFILSACDNLISGGHVANMMAAWQAAPRPNGILTLMPVEPDRLGSVGIVELDGPWVTRIVEKPPPDEAPSTISSLPLYCFTRRILDYLDEVPLSPRGEYELQDAIQMVIERDGHVRGLLVERRLTLTSPADLLDINRHYLLNGQDKPQLAPFTVGPNTQLVTPLRIEAGTVIGQDCVIGPNVYIERDCRIGDAAVIRNAVLLRESSVAAGAHIQDQVVS